MADQVINFPEGIPGFPECRSFVLSELVEEGVFQLLSCVDSDGVEMLVCIPWIFFPDYAPELSEEDRTSLGIEHPEDAIVFTAVTLAPEEGRIYLNLLGPFVVNAATRVGRQVVLDGSSHPVRAPVELERA